MVKQNEEMKNILSIPIMSRKPAATFISFVYHMLAIKLIIPKFDSFVIACIAQR